MVDPVRYRLTDFRGDSRYLSKILSYLLHHGGLRTIELLRDHFNLTGVHACGVFVEFCVVFALVFCLAVRPVLNAADPETSSLHRARSLVEGADVLLWLGKPREAPEHPRRILVHPRADVSERVTTPEGSVAVSSVTGAGLKELLARTSELAASLLPGEGAIALNRRQAAHVAEARDALEAAAATTDFVLAAEDVRAARTAFDRLTGQAGMEDVLDALFGRFCLGK